MNVRKTQAELVQFIIAAAKRQDFRKAGDLCPKAVETRGTGVWMPLNEASGQGRPSAGLLPSRPPSLPEMCSAFSGKPMGKLPPELLFHIESDPHATAEGKSVQRVNR